MRSKNLSPPLPANSDENNQASNPTYSEFVGRGVGGEGKSDSLKTAGNQEQRTHDGRHVETPEVEWLTP